MPQLYDAGALVALDDYIDKYPNIKNYFTEQEWDQLRQDDGHIYWIPQFSNIKEKRKPVRITMRHSGFRQEFLSGLIIRKSRRWMIISS